MPVCKNEVHEEHGKTQGVVPEVGVEPTRGYPRQILSLLRLPFRHSGQSAVTSIRTGQNVKRNSIPQIDLDMTLQNIKVCTFLTGVAVIAIPTSSGGGIPKRPNGADCKSVGLFLRRFESFSRHHLSWKDHTHKKSTTSLLDTS